MNEAMTGRSIMRSKATDKCEHCELVTEKVWMPTLIQPVANKAQPFFISLSKPGWRYLRGVAGVLQAEETRSLESQREIEEREAKHG